MLSISYDWYYPQQMVDKLNIGDAGYYYIDEAVNHGCGNNQEKRLYQQWEFPDIVNTINSIRPGRKFVSSGYKYCHHMAVLTQYTDVIMYSGYSEWYLSILPGCNTNMGWNPDTENLWIDQAEITGNTDQRPGWSVFRERYASKFSMTWIKTTEINEFGNLLGHAQNLGLNGVWIYGFKEQNGDTVGHYNDQWENISDAAFLHGFLRKFVQDYRIEWHCNSQDPCRYCDPTNPEGWFVYSISPIPGTMREIFY